MPRSGPMGGDLIAGLIDVVDDIRGIADDLGTRTFRVELVTVRWSGEVRGDGSPTETTVEITPRPEVIDLSMRAELRGYGRDEEGDLLLRGVSLRYTAGELYANAGDVGPLEERFYRVTDMRATGHPPRHFIASKPPAARRGDGRSDELDWVVTLRRRSDPDSGS